MQHITHRNDHMIDSLNIVMLVQSITSDYIWYDVKKKGINVHVDEIQWNRGSDSRNIVWVLFSRHNRRVLTLEEPTMDESP